MTIITPTPIAALPPAPVKGQAGFNAATELYLAALVNPFTPQVNAAVAATNANALSAEQSAITAQAATAGIAVDLWVDNKNYAVGEAVKSPAALSAGAPNPIYICKAATAGTHIDPYLDATHWAIFTVAGATGGAVYTTSTALTASSPFAVSVSGGCGTWLKLPNSTTLQAGARYHISNAGEHDVRVLNSIGEVLGFIRPRDSVTISIADTTTSAGKWVHGLEEYGITQMWQALATTQGVNNIKAAVRIDYDRVMFLVGGQAGTQLHAVVWSDSAGSIGATYLVRSAAHFANAVLCGAGQVLVVSCGNDTAMQGIVLTTAGTSITGGTMSAVTLTSSCTVIGQLIATPTGFAIAFLMGSSGCIRGISTAGGAVAFGSENILSVSSISGANDMPRLYLVGGVVRTVRYTGGIESKPFTASGSTLTAGTSVATATSIYTQYKTILLNNGNLAVLHFNSGKFVLSIFKLTGTVESVYSVNISATVTAPSNRAYYDFQTFGSKVVTFCYSHTSTSPYSALSVSVVTDNSGSATVGTIYQRILSTNDVSSAFNLSFIPSGIANEFGVNLRYESGSKYNYSLFFDCSGASPVLSKNKGIGSTIPMVAANLMPRDDFCKANAATCSNSSGVYCFNPSVVFSSNSAMLQSAQKYNAADGLKMIGKIPAPLQLLPTVRGENELSAYSVDYHGFEGGQNYGITVTRIEVCSN